MRLTQYEYASKGYLLGWTITSPKVRDYPGFFCARPWIAASPRVGRPLEWPFITPGSFDGVTHSFVACLCRTLKEARACVGPGFTNIGRETDDDIVIIESWV